MSSPKSNPNPTALAQRPAQVTTLAGSLGDEKAINARLELASRQAFLVSPSTSCTLPAGCAVSFCAVRIDSQTETHDVGFGRRSLLRVGLLKLASAAGIRWNSARSFRVDDGRDPHYCHWHVEGAWQALDGTLLSVVGDCQMDLRNDSAQVRKILESAKDAEKGRVQLRDTRAKILEHAQSKAECRAIRKALAIRTYTENELKEKPFLVARVIFDGHDADPAMARENKRAIRERMLGGISTMFGPPPAPREAMIARQRLPAPPAGAVPSSSDEELDDLVGDEASEPLSLASGSLTIPFGPEKGVVLAKASDAALTEWEGRITDHLATGRVDDTARATAWLEAARAELAARSGHKGDAA